MKKVLGKNDKVLISKIDLINLCDIFKNDEEKMRKINCCMNIMECNLDYDYLEIDSDSELVRDLEKIEKNFEIIKLVENAILFAIIHQDLVMKYRLEYLYKRICEKQVMGSQIDIFEEFYNEPEFKQYIDDNCISLESFNKNKQYVKLLRSNINR